MISLPRSNSTSNHGHEKLVSGAGFRVKWVFFPLTKFDAYERVCKKQRRWQGFASPGELLRWGPGLGHH